MASQSNGWNNFIGGVNDIAGVAKNLGDAKNAWKSTNPNGAINNNVASNNTSLDNLANTLAQNAQSNKKLLIIGGVALVAIIGAVFIFKR